MIDYFIYPKITQLTRDVAIFDCTIEFSQKYAPIHANVTSQKKKNLVCEVMAFDTMFPNDDLYFNFLTFKALVDLRSACIDYLKALEWL